LNRENYFLKTKESIYKGIFFYKGSVALLENATLLSRKSVSLSKRKSLKL